MQVAHCEMCDAAFVLLLVRCFNADFKFEEFSTDITRALVAMRDVSFHAVSLSWRFYHTVYAMLVETVHLLYAMLVETVHLSITAQQCVKVTERTIKCVSIYVSSPHL